MRGVCEDEFYLTILPLPPSPVLKESTAPVGRVLENKVKKVWKEFLKTQVPYVTRITSHGTALQTYGGKEARAGPAPAPHSLSSGRSQGHYLPRVLDIVNLYTCFFVFFNLGTSLLFPVTHPLFLLIPVTYLPTLDKLYRNMLQMSLQTIIFYNNQQFAFCQVPHTLWPSAFY